MKLFRPQTVWVCHTVASFLLLFFALGCGDSTNKPPSSAELEAFKGKEPSAAQKQKMQQAQAEAMQKYKNSSPPPYTSDPRYQSGQR